MSVKLRPFCHTTANQGGGLVCKGLKVRLVFDRFSTVSAAYNGYMIFFYQNKSDIQNCEISVSLSK